MESNRYCYRQFLYTRFSVACPVLNCFSLADRQHQHKSSFRQRSCPPEGVVQLPDKGY